MDSSSAAYGRRAAMLEWANKSPVDEARVAPAAARTPPLPPPPIGHHRDRQKAADAHAQGRLEGKEIVVDTLTDSYESPIRVRPLDEQQANKPAQDNNTPPHAELAKMSPDAKSQAGRKLASQVEQAKRNDPADYSAGELSSFSGRISFADYHSLSWSRRRWSLASEF